MEINPVSYTHLAGVSAVPMAARVSQKVGQQANPANFLLMHAMGPNVAGVIGSAVAAGVLIAILEMCIRDRLDDAHKIDKRDPRVEKIKQWVDAEYEGGRTTVIGDLELEHQVYLHMPELLTLRQSRSE